MKATRYLLLASALYVASALSSSGVEAEERSSAELSNPAQCAGSGWHELVPGVWEQPDTVGSVHRYAFGEAGSVWIISQASAELVELQKRYNATRAAYDLQRVNELQSYLERWRTDLASHRYPSSWVASVCSGGGGMCICPGSCWADSGGCGCSSTTDPVLD